MPVTLVHGVYPMRGRPQREEHSSVRAARAAVHSRYRDESGWWFQINCNGKEVWSSDHEIAALKGEKDQ
jgi:hypothetical protein